METEDRSKFFGGTDIAKLLGISPWGNQVDLWLEKIAARPARELDPKVLKRGKRLEGYIIDLAREEYGIEVIERNHRYHDPDVPYFSVEVDAVHIVKGQERNVQIKTVHPLKAREWGELDSDELPMHYLAQEQWACGVTRREGSDYFVLLGDDLRRYSAERDDLTIKVMREKAQDFWQTFVVPKVRPPMEWDTEHALEIVKRLYPGTNGQVLTATEDDEQWRSVLRNATSKADKYLNVAHGAKAHLLDRMGEAARMKFTDGKELRRKLIEVKGYVVETRKQIDARFVNSKD